MKEFSKVMKFKNFNIERVAFSFIITKKCKTKKLFEELPTKEDWKKFIDCHCWWKIGKGQKIPYYEILIFKDENTCIKAWSINEHIKE